MDQCIKLRVCGDLFLSMAGPSHEVNRAKTCTTVNVCLELWDPTRRVHVDVDPRDLLGDNAQIVWGFDDWNVADLAIEDIARLVTRLQALPNEKLRFDGATRALLATT
jgi:hypothetical protein